jgi:hypothetical protein
MKRLLVGTLLLCSLMSASAFANTIIGYSPNDGSGDNFGFINYNGNGFVAGGGGTPADFFNTLGYVPGSILGGSTDIFFFGGFARIGPISSDVFFNVGTLFMSTITLPTNGKDFVAPVTISFGATGTLDNPLQQSIDVSGSADGHIRFDFFNGAYYPESFVQVPEPGTLGLLGVGLLGVAARVRNKLLHQS